MVEGNRPIGVVFLTVAYMIVGCLSLILALELFLIGRGTYSDQLSLWLYMGPHDIFLGSAEIAFLLIGVLCLAVGVGLLKGKRWGWMLGLISVLILLAFSVFATAMGIYHRRFGIAGWLDHSEGQFVPIAPVHAMGSVVISGILLCYLFKPSLRLWFQRQSTNRF